MLVFTMGRNEIAEYFSGNDLDSFLRHPKIRLRSQAGESVEIHTIQTLTLRLMLKGYLRYLKLYYIDYI